MSAPAASPCTVILNQRREQAIQHHHEQCDQAAIAPCTTLSRYCTVVENGQVVVKLMSVQPTQPLVDTEPAS
ncbi:hypothetical protein [Stenomitos frigidus]|uniref:Uncharacterized protein n=1 Tax=Stenomitos frigidus ULC18 TaxID=2107698 RepID=A0A2T1E685_9CYAN|nr:hypothetical protein [Stenomitos frigidus]PSB28257.1 hypothetical protein C7B82_13720 [Stenomitos frigidus ULC18]